MRTYPRNSPEAAARIVALLLIADGHVCRSEIEAWERLDGPRELGLEPDAMPRILQTMCEELLLGAYASGSVMASLDERALASLLAEVDDPDLQRTILRIAIDVSRADRHLADGEALVLATARRVWRIGDEAGARSVAAVDPHPA